MTEREARTPALKPEEAALLPALSRRSLTGGAALKTARQKADVIRDKKAANEISSMASNEPQATAAARLVSRAALHQALKRGSGHLRKGNHF